MKKNWKTTLIGWLVAGLIVFLSSLQKDGLTVSEAATAGGIALLATVAKDFDTTGNGDGATKLPPPFV